MAQETITNEARTPTTLKVETSVSLPAFEAVAKKITKNSAEVARQAFGEDSCTPFHLQGTFEVDGVMTVIDEKGMIEIGTSYERAQTTAFKLTEFAHQALAVMGTHSPKMLEAVMASMIASRDGGDSEKALIDAGFNMTEASKARATEHMRSLATSSVRKVSAGVKVSLDA